MSTERGRARAIGRVLREARKAAGLTQQQVAAEARMDRSYVSDVERAGTVISVDRFMRLCQAIGISAATLMAAVESAEAGRQRGR